jgi:hypothetical protein
MRSALEHSNVGLHYDYFPDMVFAKYLDHAKFYGFAALKGTVSLFWDMTPHHWATDARRFDRASWYHFQESNFNAELFVGHCK